MDPTWTFVDFIEIDQNVEILGDLADVEIVGEVRSLSEEKDDNKCKSSPQKLLKRLFHSLKQCVHLMNGGR